MSNDTVQSIMTRRLITLFEEDNLDTVAKNLDTYRFRHLPVVDGKKLVGVVSQRDLLRATASGSDSSAVNEARVKKLRHDTFVREIMTERPLTAPADMPIRKAAKLLTESHVGCLPVVSPEGDLIGMVTEHDLLAYLARSGET